MQLRTAEKGWEEEEGDAGSAKQESPGNDLENSRRRFFHSRLEAEIHERDESAISLFAAQSERGSRARYTSRGGGPLCANEEFSDSKTAMAPRRPDSDGDNL